MGILILNSGRCSHGRCYFCGYGRIRGSPPTEENVTGCLKDFFNSLEGNEVRVYGSGSFFDEKQVPASARRYFIEECRRKKVGYVQVESRPEYVTKEVLREFQGLNVAVAMGLESADDELLKKLEKGYGTKEYEGAAGRIREAGFKVRTYLLVNPPFTDDVDGELDMSVEYALKHSDSIVLINTLPHSNAPLMRQWVSGEWRFLGREEFREAVFKWVGNPRVEVEEETFHFTPVFPDEMREDLTGLGENYLTHPHFEAWHDYIIRWYRPPEGRVLLFLPCSYVKPYSMSKTHKAIMEVLGSDRRRFHEVMLSNAGVIPREFENRYPFNSYDWDERMETPEIKRRYIEVTSERIRNYLTAHMKYYDGVACYLKPSSESYQALKKACDDVGVGLRNLLTDETYEQVTGEKSPLRTAEALGDLRDGIGWCLRNSTS